MRTHNIAIVYNISRPANLICMSMFHQYKIYGPIPLLWYLSGFCPIFWSENVHIHSSVASYAGIKASLLPEVLNTATTFLLSDLKLGVELHITRDEIDK